MNDLFKSIKALIAAIALISLLILSFSCNKDENTMNAFQQKIPPEDYEVLTHPLNVVLYTVVPADGEDEHPRAPGLKLSDPVKLTKEQVHDVQKIILNDKNYFYNINKSCLFSPEYAFSFENHHEILLWISPACRQMKLTSRNQQKIFETVPEFVNLRNVYNQIMK